MSRLVDQPDVSMGLESASSSDDFEDEDDEVLRKQRVHLSQLRLGKYIILHMTILLTRGSSIFILILSMVVPSAGWYRSR